MGYQTDLLPALRDWGLNVHIVNGWSTRGSSTFNPRGSVNHHTAGSTRYSMPSLNILINGHGTLPGPLCNVGQSRSSNFDPKAKYDDVYLIAAGRANHAGSGSWKGLSGNSSVFGLEIEHCGYLDREGFGERRQHTAHLVHCAFMQAGGFSPAYICQHKEWTPRKIDFVGSNGVAFRSAVTVVNSKQKDWFDMTPQERAALIEDIANAVTHKMLVADTRWLDWRIEGLYGRIIANADTMRDSLVNILRSEILPLLKR